MGEKIGVDTREKISPGQVLLLSEPIFRVPEEYKQHGGKFIVPLGTEYWVDWVCLNQQDKEEVLADEYVSIATSLKELGIDFRIIVAHRAEMDDKVLFALLAGLRVRGLGLNASISSTCFPRDMMVNFGTETYVNPEANFTFPDGSSVSSPLGDGGRVLQSGKKVLLPFMDKKLVDEQIYDNHIGRLRSLGFEVGQLPMPWAVTVTPGEEIVNCFTTDHLDRAASLIQGKDGKAYLLVDSNYANPDLPLKEQYWPMIESTCKELDITPVIVPRMPSSIPYALNLQQFADITVLMTSGDEMLKYVVEDIVGKDKVKVTSRPIIYYPLYRRGGIRCMMVCAPERIVAK